MFGAVVIAAGLAIEAEKNLIDTMRSNLSPAEFEKWMDERTTERRHKELCRSIEKAGENARPRGLGIFW